MIKQNFLLKTALSLAVIAGAAKCGGITGRFVTTKYHENQKEVILDPYTFNKDSGFDIDGIQQDKVDTQKFTVTLSKADIQTDTLVSAGDSFIAGSYFLPDTERLMVEFNSNNNILEPDEVIYSELEKKLPDHKLSFILYQRDRANPNIPHGVEAILGGHEGHKALSKEEAYQKTAGLIFNTSSDQTWGQKIKKLFL